MKSQNSEILAYLSEGNTITPSYAVSRFRCFRLAARIYDLRQQGYKISSKTIKRRSKRTGRSVAFAAYSLDKS